jgi:hypothetical protein
VFIALEAYGTTPGKPRWNPLVDENEDGKINLADIMIIIRN